VIVASATRVRQGRQKEPAQLWRALRARAAATPAPARVAAVRGVKQPQSLPIAPEPPLTAQACPAGQMPNATAPSESVTATVAWKVTVSVAPATG